MGFNGIIHDVFISTLQMDRYLIASFSAASNKAGQVKMTHHLLLECIFYMSKCMFNKSFAFIVCLFIGISYTHAGDTPDNPYRLNLSLPEASSALALNNKANFPIILASSQERADSNTINSNVVRPEYKDRIFTANKVHKYLGIGSIGTALLTLFAPKGENGAHEALAKASALLGLGALATGLTFHFEDLDMKAGMKDPDNLHAFWATLGIVGIAMATSTGPDASHVGYGSLGTIGMIIGVKYTW